VTASSAPSQFGIGAVNGGNGIGGEASPPMTGLGKFAAMAIHRYCGREHWK